MPFLADHPQYQSDQEPGEREEQTLIQPRFPVLKTDAGSSLGHIYALNDPGDYLHGVSRCQMGNACRPAWRIRLTPIQARGTWCIHLHCHPVRILPAVPVNRVDLALIPKPKPSSRPVIMKDGKRPHMSFITPLRKGHVARQ